MDVNVHNPLNKECNCYGIQNAYGYRTTIRNHCSCIPGDSRRVITNVPFDYQVEFYTDMSEAHIGKLRDRQETVIRGTYAELLCALRLETDE